MPNSTPKSLLVVIPSLHHGGSETHLSQILPGLRAKGWEITVFLTSGCGEIAKQLESCGIIIRRPSKSFSKMHNKHKLLRVPLVAITFFELSKYLIKHRPNIVHFMLPEAYLLGGLCCITTRQKNLSMNRRSLNNYQKKYPILRKFEHWLHKKMSCIITNSQQNVQQLIGEEGVAKEKVKLIYNGLDYTKFSNLNTLNQESIRQEFNFAPSSFTIIVIANIIPYKGHATLLSALNKISAQLPSDWQLLCVGHKHDYINELEKLSSELNITHHVHWLGAQQSVVPLLAISNLAISCSYEEGFSNAILEAMAASLPLIVTDVGGNPEAIIADESGLVVPARDDHALANAILQMASNKVLAQKMGAAARQRATEHFSLSTCVNAYHDIFTKIIIPAKDCGSNPERAYQ